jgi:ankyrin repeat protein
MAGHPSPLLPEKALAALFRKDIKALKRFLNEATVNLRSDLYGRTLLMLAVGVEDGLGLVRLLIEAGADVNLADTRGRYTALHFAVIDFRLEAVRVLLKAGADPNARDASGWSPLHHLVRGHDLMKLLALELVGHGADPDQADGAGVSAREEAERTGRRELFQGLVTPKRRPKAKGRRTRRPAP